SGQDELRALSARLAMAEQDERDRIASELHDGIGQWLTAASIRAGAAKSLPPDRVFAELVQVRELIDRAISQTRSLSTELCPAAFNEIPFPSSLEWLVARLHELHRLDVKFSAEGADVPVSRGVRALLFRATRELILN